jgi:hypothetical protein
VVLPDRGADSPGGVVLFTSPSPPDRWQLGNLTPCSSRNARSSHRKSVFSPTNGSISVCSMASRLHHRVVRARRRPRGQRCPCLTTIGHRPALAREVRPWRLTSRRCARLGILAEGREGGDSRSMWPVAR